MILKLNINLENATVECDDPTITVNNVNFSDGNLIVELSKPDPELSDINTITIAGT